MIVGTRPEAAAFAPFGALIDAPAQAGTRAMYGEWLAPVPGLALQFHLNRVPRATLPAALEQVERHPHAAQVFLPVDVSRYLVTVMPSDAAGAPDPARGLSFVLPGHVGVVYRPGSGMRA
jgi:ureidoglycolate lyase